MNFNPLPFLNSLPKKPDQESDSTSLFNTESERLDPQKPEKLDSLDDLDGLEEKTTSSSTDSNSLTVAALVKLLPLGLSSLSLLYLFHLGGQIASIRNNHNQVMVQTINGQAITAEPVDNYLRTPVTVEQTVKQWTDLTFNWVQKLPNGEQDKGTLIGSKLFPTRLIQGSSLMSYDMQQIWYQVFQRRDDYLPPNFIGSKATRVFFPLLQTQSRPPLDPRTEQPISNRYEVEEHGDWVEYSPEAPQGKLIDRIHLLIRLRPVVKTEAPLSDDASPLQRIAYQLRANGLEIYDIERLKNVR